LSSGAGGNGVLIGGTSRGIVEPREKPAPPTSRPPAPSYGFWRPARHAR
jgi:hypothetical protein